MFQGEDGGGSFFAPWPFFVGRDECQRDLLRGKDGEIAPMFLQVAGNRFFVPLHEIMRLFDVDGMRKSDNHDGTGGQRENTTRNAPGKKTPRLLPGAISPAAYDNHINL